VNCDLDCLKIITWSELYWHIKGYIHWCGLLKCNRAAGLNRPAFVVGMLKFFYQKGSLSQILNCFFVLQEMVVSTKNNLFQMSIH